HVSEKLPHFFLPQRQQLSDFSKYLSGTKPGLLDLMVFLHAKKNNRRLLYRRLFHVCCGAFSLNDS
ncbi:MAG: hypothetical protein E6850_19600, partial [Leclercia adecarboxylata]|nr:hypothetical protein [Leclercia adecarboxylata]